MMVKSQEAEEPVASPPLEEINLHEIIPALVVRAGKPRPLEKIIADHLRGEENFDARRALKRNLQKRIAAQDSTSGAELLARSVIKQIDFHYTQEVAEVDLNVKAAVVDELAVNVARQLVVAANFILQYPKAMMELHAAIEDRQSQDVARLRTDRILLSDKFRKAMVNVARASVGDDVEMER